MPSPNYKRHSSGNEPIGQSTRQSRLITGALILAAGGPFVRALGFGFVYDDTWIVQHNPAITGWRSLVTLWQRPYWTDPEGAQAGLYRPVHTALLAIIRNAGGGWPLWFHVYSILLHVVATLLVWRMLARGVRPWPAAFGALWFAVHPIHVEAVANISNSAESLVAVWTLGLYLALAAAVERGASWRDALIAGALVLLAVLSKESGSMSLGIAQLAAVAWRTPRDATVRAPVSDTPQPTLLIVLARQWRVAIAGLATLVAVAIIRSMVLGSSLPGVSMAAVGIEHMRAPARIWAMLSLGPLVFGLLAWPRMQNPYYGPSSFPAGSTATIAASMTIVLVVLVMIWAARRARSVDSQSLPDTRPLAAITWTLLAFLPASNLFLATGQILAERTLYMSSIGIAMLVAWGMERLAMVVQPGKERRISPISTRWGRAAALAGSGAIVLVYARFALLAQRATATWRTHRTVVEQMIAADPAGYRGHYLRALDLRRGPSADSTAQEFATAYRLYSRDAQLNFEYAVFLLERKRARDAVQVSRTLMDDARMRRDPDAIKVYLEARGAAYGADSVLAAASRLFRVQPHPTVALYVGLAHEARGEKAAALKAYRSGLRLAPGDSVLTARVAGLESAAF